MKRLGGKYYKSIRVIDICMTLIIVLIITTIILHDWENNPFVMSLLWASNRFTKPSPPPSNPEGCHYGKGRWVADSRRPLYSGFGCKRWLSRDWACRRTNRIDFSYEGYKWEPSDCKIPDFDRFQFLSRMKNKTIAYIGDSLGRQQFQSMMCMLTVGEEADMNSEVKDVGEEYELGVSAGAIRPDGWAYRFLFTNTTVLYYWSATLSDLEPVKNPTTFEIAMHLDRPPAFLRKYIQQFDVLVLNTGHHWNKGKLQKNHWVFYMNGYPNQDKSLNDFGRAKNFTVHSIVNWVDGEMRVHPKQMKAFFRSISPRHFFNGEWNHGGSCNNTVPMSRGNQVLQDGSRDRVVESAVMGKKMKILDVTGLSELRDEGHKALYGTVNGASGGHGYDCLHWCLPGVPDTWNEILAAQI